MKKFEFYVSNQRDVVWANNQAEAAEQLREALGNAAR